MRFIFLLAEIFNNFVHVNENITYKTYGTRY